MSIIKFKASITWPNIERVTVEKETAQSVWIRGWAFENGAGSGEPARAAKASEYVSYFDTWAEAKQFLLDKAETQIVCAHQRLAIANDYLGNVKGMKVSA